MGELNDNINITFRNSIIGPDLERDGIGLLNWFMQQSGGIKGYTKSIWSGVTTLFLAQMIDKAAHENICGLYHLTNNRSISKYELLKLFRAAFEDIAIEPVDGVAADKSLLNTRGWGIAPSYEKMIGEMREWMLRHRDFYPHYELR